MENINKQEFLKRLEENKHFSDPKELIDERFPCLIYFKKEYLPKMNTILGPAHLLFGNEEYNDSKFTAVNRAWDVLIKNKDKF